MNAEQAEDRKVEAPRERQTPEQRAANADAAWSAAEARQAQEQRTAEARQRVAATVADLPPLQPVDIINRTSENRVTLADDVGAIQLTPTYDGYLDVVMHGDATGTQADIGGQRTDFTAEQTAQLIESTRSWDHRPIRLMSCSTGQEGYAQQLADRLRVPVYAPDEALSVYANGRTTVDNDGRWRRFQPAQR